MTTYNTGNPLGSTDVYDRYDNSENLDNFSNGPLDAYPDRFGVSRQSLQGIRNASQYVILGAYAAGLNFTAQNQVFSYLGEFYAPGPSIVLPYTATGVGAAEIADFRSVGDAVLRQDLLSNGEPLIGTRDGLLSDTITALEDTITALEDKIAESEFNDVGLSSVVFGSAASGVVLMIGDSNAEGAGSTGNSFRNGYMGLLNRAIFNADDYGNNRLHGFDFEVLTRLNQGAFLDGCSTNGSFVAAGISDSRVSLAPGQTITFTGRQAANTDVFYVPTLSSGSLIIKRNGITIKTHAVVTTGVIGTTYPTYPYGPERELAQTDVVTIEASGGTVVVSGIAGWRLSTHGTLVYNAARQGWGFDEFASPARVAEGAAYLNSFYGAETPRSVYIFLGTNNMIAISPKTPADYITALDALVDAYRAAITSTIKNFVVWVPPKPFDSLPLGTYTEYAEAIATYCAANDIECVRMDQSIMGEPDSRLMADTRHYNDQGHALIARIAANHMGIPARFAPAVRIPTATGRAGVTYLTPVSPWTGSITARITADGVCLLSGIPQQNAATTGHIATLPVGLRPSRDVYLLATTGGIGAVQVVVRADGKITASGANPISVSLDGLTFDTP